MALALSTSTRNGNGASAEQPDRAFTDALVEICQAMGSSLNLREVLATLLRLTIDHARADQGSILLFNTQTDRLEMLATHGLPEEFVQKGYIPRKGSIAEWVIEHNQPLIINDTPTTTNYKALDARRKIVSAMCVPLRVGGRVIGTINLNRTREDYGVFVDNDLAAMVILAGMAAIFIENSRLHEQNLKAERLAAVGQTVAGISHCIKNVLTGVKGGMSLVEMAIKGGKPDVMTQGVDILKRNLDRLSSIVLDMLDYSKDRVPTKCTTSLHSVAEETFATVQAEAQVRQLELVNHVDPDLPFIQADGQQLYRCVLNLVHNAIDATPAGGQVWIKVEYSEDAAALHKLGEREATRAAIIRVGDTGPGIPEDLRTALFEPFFSTKGSKGTGLGLAVTRKIIQEHGGHIEVESGAEDPAVFAIYLPA